MATALAQPRPQETAHAPQPTPRVSVGMPVFNAERHLGAAIDSILEQTYKNLELILSDNASTDRSLAICTGYAERDPRVRVLRSSANLGAHPNYRKVALAARGEYFKWASSNDLLAGDYIEGCVRALDQRPDAVLAFGPTFLFDEDPRTATPYVDGMNLEADDPYIRFRCTLERLRLNNVLNGVMRRQALLNTSMLPDYMSSDNLLIAELALAGKIIEVPQTRFYRRMNRESSTRLQSSDAVRRHLYPAGGSRALFQSWRLVRGYITAVMRGRIPFRSRLRALGYVLHQTYWSASGLWADLGEAFRFFAAGGRRR